MGERGKTIIGWNEILKSNLHSVISLATPYNYEPNMKGQTDFSKEQMLGIEAALWTEWYQENETMEYQLFPRLLALSEVAWSKGKNYESFLKKVDTYEQLLKLYTINSTSFDRTTI